MGDFLGEPWLLLELVLSLELELPFVLGREGQNAVIFSTFLLQRIGDLETLLALLLGLPSTASSSELNSPASSGATCST